MLYPLVSIVIPVYKVEKFIVQCARSVLRQDYPNLEIIFWDDCSPDNSIALLKKELNTYPQSRHNVKIYANERNLGTSATREKAFRVATGDYIWAIDSDDWIESSACFQMINVAIKEKADIVFCDLVYEESNSTRLESMKTPINPDALLKTILRSSKNGNLANKLIRRTLLVDNCHVPPEIKIGEDVSCLVQVLKYATPKITYYPKCLYHYRMNPESVSHQSNLFFRNEIIFCNYIMKIIETEAEKLAFAEFQGRLLLQIMSSGKGRIDGVCSIFDFIRSYRWKLRLPIEYRIALSAFDHNCDILGVIFIKLFWGYQLDATDFTFRVCAWTHTQSTLACSMRPLNTIIQFFTDMNQVAPTVTC